MGRTLSDEQIAELAAEHEAARQSASSIDPVSPLPRCHLGRRLCDPSRMGSATGRVGLSSSRQEDRSHQRAMQQAMKIDEPDYGILFDYMFMSQRWVARAGQSRRPED